MIIKAFTFVLAFALPLPSLADNITSDDLISEIIGEYAAECAKDGQSLEVDGDEITQLTTAQGKTAYVVYGEFACSEDGHLWCGSGGCPFDIVIERRRYSHRQIRRLLDEPPDFISVGDDGSLIYGFRGTEFIWKPYN